MSAAGATAVNSLFFGPVAVEPGMVVLTQGTGSVRCLAIQLASAIGATVISTSSEDSKLEIAKKLGAIYIINYRTYEDWAAEVLRLTDGKGVDHVVEVGGMGTIEQSIRSTKQGGLISLVGFLASSEATDIVPSLIYGGKTARGIFGSRKDMSRRLVQIVEQHGIHPMIGKTVEWPDAKEAFRVSMERSEEGKIVIRVWNSDGQGIIAK
ncbi:hypothetical protein OEA41_007991 [Lepraria neglecta]|uniref:Alcohol dehydrogenase-like C-terminal domain-containing protein n=1 Tax=Lepraria neglecta TaxID=209136 RepID=A0AAE0DNG4_9LECA|nr:hypothetical protein OEA41_007991 [Lepraria neglecta]